MPIAFTDVGHEYRRISDNMRFISVSGMLSRYKPAFKEQHWKQIKAFQMAFGEELYRQRKNEWVQMGNHLLQDDYPEYLSTFLEPHLQEVYQESLDYYRNSWEFEKSVGLSRGTHIHKMLEHLAYAEGKVRNPLTDKLTRVFEKPDSRYDNEVITPHLLDLPKDTAFPELLVYIEFPKPVYDEKLDCEIGGLAGQVDLMVSHTDFFDGATANVIDFKSNKKLSEKPIYWKNYGYETWAFPAHMIRSSDVDYYTHQLSFYMMMLRHHGYNPGKLVIRHFSKSIEVPYQETHVLDMLSYYYFLGSEGELWRPTMGLEAETPAP